MRFRTGAVFVSVVGLAFAGTYACGSDDDTSSASDAGAGSCASFADAATLNESLGSATLKGSNVDGTFCARVTVRKGSYNHQSPSDLVLEINGIPESYAFATPPAVGGTLLVYIGLNTAAPGVSASTDPGQCGTLVAGPRRTPTAEEEAHCAEDAGGSCGSGCFSINHAPCKPVPKEEAYQASLAGNCLGEILQPQGSWKVTITSLEPKSFGPPYVAHGTVEGTLLERGDGGSGGAPATLTITF